MDPAAEIAIQARRFRLLADQPEHQYGNERVDAALADPGRALDGLLGAGVDAGDRLAANLVRMLREPSARRGLIGVLRTWPVKTGLAVFYALPPERRVALRAEPGPHVAGSSLEQSIVEFMDLLDETFGEESDTSELTDAERSELDEFRRTSLSRQVRINA